MYWLRNILKTALGTKSKSPLDRAHRRVVRKHGKYVRLVIEHLERLASENVRNTWEPITVIPGARGYSVVHALQPDGVSRVSFINYKGKSIAVIGGPSKVVYVIDSV